jgi:hypothetical protein
LVHSPPAPWPQPPRAHSTELVPPKLVIGRIDVTVLATPAPAQAKPSRPERGFASRNYLKRL